MLARLQEMSKGLKSGDPATRFQFSLYQSQMFEKALNEFNLF
jgi:hypothetical protein